MAGLQEFASPGGGGGGGIFYLEAGWPQWNLSDIPGTHHPLN